MVATLWETVAKRVRAESIETCAELLDERAAHWKERVRQTIAGELRGALGLKMLDQYQMAADVSEAAARAIRELKDGDV